MDAKQLQKLLPFLAIGGVVIWLVLKLAKSGSDSQVVNRVIPVQQPTEDKVGLRQIEAQFELGKLSLANQAELAQASISAEKQRLEFQNKALEFSSQANLKALEIESSRQTALAAIAGDSALYDTTIRANAARELGRQSSTSQLLNSLLGTGSSILQSLLRNQQSQQRSSGGGGSSGGGFGTPPFNPNAQRQAQRPADYNFIGRVLDAFRNQPYSFSNSSLAGQYLDPLDLQPYYDREVQAYDNWLDYDIIGYYDFEPEGFVSVDYSPEDFYIYYEE